jgi:hypothetical protein
MHHRLLSIAVLFLALALPAARAEVLPQGIEADARAWYSALVNRHPAGGTHALRQAAAAKAADAINRRDFAAAAQALEERISLGQAGVADLLKLATAYASQSPPRHDRALRAAAKAYELTRFSSSETQASQQALSAVADALTGLDRQAAALPVLEELARLDATNPAYAARLAELRRRVGMQVRATRIEADSEPPRGCVAFTVPPSKRPDFHPADWTRLAPAPPNAAITLENEEICVSGLPPASATTVTFRAGMPADTGSPLAADIKATLVTPHRAPRVDFDTRLFVLPMGQAQAVTLSTVNVTAVALQLHRFTERNVPPFLRNAKLGEAVDTWSAQSIAEGSGSTVWTGRADIPLWQADKPVRTSLPLPDALRAAGPGLYAFVAKSADGGTEAGSVQIVQQTDLAPTVWRGNDGLTVQVRAYSDAKPKPGIRLDLLARNNDVLAQAATDAQGTARFPAPLLRGDGPLAPAVLHAFGPASDFAALDLAAAAFDLSDRGVEGQPQPGALDAYVWTDRGIYRPGETAHVMALLRDPAGAPVDLAAHVIVKKPNGQVFSDTAPPRIGGASVHAAVTLSATATAGIWTVELKAEPDGPAVGTATFKVDSFVPDRLAVEPGTLPDRLVPGTEAAVPVTARFLYGAPAAHMPAAATMRLVPDPVPFPALKGWRVGLENEAYAPEDTAIEMPPTDGEGSTTLKLLIKRAPDTTVPLRAAIDIAVTDPAGRAAHGRADIPVQASGPLIGIKPRFEADAVDSGATAAFSVAAFAPTGARIPLKARYRLVRERPDWRLVGRDGTARYETVWKDEPLETRDIDIPAADPMVLSSRVDWGRYRIEVADPNGLSVTSYRFRAGWASDSPDVPDRVDVSAARKTAPPGSSVTVHIVPPFAGEATVLVLGERVHSLSTLSVPATGADIDIPVTQDWGPGAYVTVHVFRPGGGGTGRPGRAIGLAWIGVDPAARTLDVAWEAPAVAAPRQRTEVAVRTAPGAWVQVSAVDEGILRLTRFASPDAAKHFLGRRRLGIDIRDDWGRLIVPPDGPAAILRQGGDEAGAMPRDDPDRTASLFFPPVQAGPDGIARFELPIGDFAGEARLMAMAWQDRRVGAASKPLTLRDAVVAEALLPRYLAPGDSARVAVLLHNLDLPAGAFEARLTAAGPLELTGPPTFALTLPKGARQMPTSTVRATGNGSAVLRLEVTGPEGFRAAHETKLAIRTARGRTTTVTAASLAPGATETLAPDTALYLPGTWTATATFGGRTRYDTAALVQALDRYPFACLEQATSRGFPLAFLPDGPVAGDDRAGRLQKAVNQVLDRQRYDGAFALWRAGGDAEPWLTPYATEFLIRARRAGAYVPDAALTDALRFLAEQVSERDEDAALPAQAYRLYALALAGQGKPGVARVLAERPDRLPTPLAKAQLAAALAIARDTDRAERLFRSAVAATGRNFWLADYGTALRDRMALTVLLIESGLLQDRLAPLLATLPGADLSPDRISTQEQAWAAAAAAVAGRGLPPVTIEAAGAPLPPAPTVSLRLAAPETVRNAGTAPVPRTLSTLGVPARPPPAEANGLSIQRQLFAANGTRLAEASLKQGETFVLVLDVRSADDADHAVSVVQGLPAGWEIAARFGAGDIPGLPWLGKLAELDAQPAADDRFAAIGQMGKGVQSMRVAVRLRAVSVGEYELPGADAADMYRPAIAARLASGRTAVTAP